MRLTLAFFLLLYVSGSSFAQGTRLRETWRIQREYFYDPNMHGAVPTG